MQSNTALFSEKLVGANASSPPPYAGDQVNAKRGIFLISTMPTNYNAPTATSNAADWPPGLPGHSGNHASATERVARVFLDTGINQWHWVVNTYNHYNTPNKLTCLS